MGKAVQHKQKRLRFNGKVCMFAFSIDACRVSSFEALLHVPVLCCRFLSRTRKAKSPTGPITVTDLRVAKTKWLRKGHHSSQSETASSADLKLSLFYDGEGIIRCRERPTYVDLPERLTHPILVPASSVLAKLGIIKESQRQVPLMWAHPTPWLGPDSSIGFL